MANLANSSQEQSHVSESIHLRHESIRAVELAKELQAAAASFMAKKWDEEQSLRQRALALDSNLRNLQALIGSAAKTQAFHQDVAEEYCQFIYTRWIYHHYCAILMALVCLTWEIKAEPDCAQEQRGVQLFLAWAMLQGIAMLLQNRYQRQRLYTRIALGKSGRMDVVWGETAGVQGQLWLLCPSLFTLQAFEGYIGLLLLKAAVIGITSNWQVLVSGILLIVMAIGNFINTVQVLVAKSRVKAKVKRSKSKQQLDQVGSGQSEQDKNFMSSD